MTKPLTFAVDMDLCVLDPIFQENGWCWWLQAISYKPYPVKDGIIQGLPEQLPYDLNELYPDLTHSEAFAFWKKGCLYEDLKPYKDAVDVINWLAEEGHHIVFATASKPEHQTSKFNFVKRYFNIPKKQLGVIHTFEKRYVACDVAIDDRHTYINSYKDSVIKFCRETPYIQDEELGSKVIKVVDFYEMYDKLKEMKAI